MPHSLIVAVAEERGHEARHVNWLGLSSENRLGFMPKITAYSLARVARRLVIVVPLEVPAPQRELFDAVLDEGPAVFSSRYSLPRERSRSLVP